MLLGSSIFVTVAALTSFLSSWKKSLKIPTAGRKNLEARYQILAAMTLQKPQENSQTLSLFDNICNVIKHVKAP